MKSTHEVTCCQVSFAKIADTSVNKNNWKFILQAMISSSPFRVYINVRRLW